MPKLVCCVLLWLVVCETVRAAVIPQEYSERFNISLYRKIIPCVLRCRPLPIDEILLLINNTTD